MEIPFRLNVALRHRLHDLRALLHDSSCLIPLSLLRHCTTLFLRLAVYPFSFFLELLGVHRLHNLNRCHFRQRAAVGSTRRLCPFKGRERASNSYLFHRRQCVRLVAVSKHATETPLDRLLGHKSEGSKLGKSVTRRLNIGTVNSRVRLVQWPGEGRRALRIHWLTESRSDAVVFHVIPMRQDVHGMIIVPNMTGPWCVSLLIWETYLGDMIWHARVVGVIWRSRDGGGCWRWRDDRFWIKRSAMRQGGVRDMVAMEMCGNL